MLFGDGRCWPCVLSPWLRHPLRGGGAGADASFGIQPRALQGEEEMDLDQGLRNSPGGLPPTPQCLPRKGPSGMPASAWWGVLGDAANGRWGAGVRCAGSWVRAIVGRLRGCNGVETHDEPAWLDWSCANGQWAVGSGQRR